VPSIEKSTRFPLIQSLRGLAAFWVVLFHAAEGHHIDRLLALLPALLGDVVFRAGHFGVPIFFALSGFVITHSLRDLPLSWPVFGRFVVRRSIRLDPPYWASIVLVIGLALLSARVQHEPYTVPSAGTIAAHLFYLQQILHMPEINAVYWTLTFEFQFYLFFAGMMTLAASLGGARLRQAIWVAMEIVAIVAAFGGFSWANEGLFVTLWPAFFVGVLAYKGIESNWARIGLALLVASLLIVQDSMALAASATAVFLLLMTMAGLATREPKLALGQWLGAISYSLYLIHNPLTGAIGFVGHKIAGPGLAGDIFALAAIIVGCLAGAAAFWWVIERPAHRFTKKVRLV
jgi:peptidoglycan/LPS O-acetylase OafA/YrhL